MKHLTKFIEYLKENKEELDLDLIVNDFLVPIKHLGVKIDTHKSLETSGEFAGYNQTTISFYFEDFNKSKGGDIIDNKIWDFLDELIMFKNVIDETYGYPVTIYFGSSSKITIYIYNKIEENDEYLIKKLYDIFTDWNNSSKKIHFVSNKKDSIEAYIEGTKIVWDNYIRSHEIDLSKYDLEITDIPKGLGYWSSRCNLKIVITVKK